MLIKPEEERVDPRIKRTRQLLQTAFLELLKEKSFQAITVQDIAARATINRVTFYAHFVDKYALLEFTVRDLFRQQLRKELAPDALFSPENLACMIETVCVFAAEMDHHCPPPHGHMEPVMENQIKEELYETLYGWLADLPARSPSGYPTPQQAAMISSWAIYGAAVQWKQQDQKQASAAQYARQVLPLILSSFQVVVMAPDG
jgi:AcrR family transcriptional regulator